MTTYRVCDFGVESNIPLVELPAATGLPPQLRFHFGIQRGDPARQPRWLFHARAPDGRIRLSVAGVGGRYLLRFPHQADFVVSPDGGTIHGYRRREIPLKTMRHLLLDQVVPFVLSWRSELVLHASAVATKACAIAFVGRSGTGKSTLSASLAKSGMPLVADDFLLLREGELGPLAIPSYPGLRLWSDAAEEVFGPGPPATTTTHSGRKQRCGVGNRAVPFAEAPLPLVRIYTLSPSASAAVEITPLSPREAFVELIQHSFRLDTGDRDRLRRQFESLGAAADRVAFRRIALPRQFALLPAAREAILADLADSPSLT